MRLHLIALEEGTSVHEGKGRTLCSVFSRHLQRWAQCVCSASALFCVRRCLAGCQGKRTRL